MQPEATDEQTLAALWHAYACGDVEAALACAGRDSAQGWTIAFHCQQAVEKAYKGALVRQGAEIPKTHKLTLLHILLDDNGLKGPLSVDVLGILTPFAIDDKYPSLTIVPISRDDAIPLIAHAQVVVVWLQAMLGR